MEQRIELVKQEQPSEYQERIEEVFKGQEGYLLLGQATVLDETGSSLPEELAPVTQQIVNIALTVPLIHPSKFAEQIGRSTGVIGGWLDAGYLPTVKVGRYQMINLALLTENLKKGFVL